MAHKTRRHVTRARKANESLELKRRAAYAALDRLKAKDPRNSAGYAGVAVTGGHKGQTIELILWGSGHG